MNIKLLTEHHLELLSLEGGYTGSSESTLVKMLHCWKSHAVAHITSAAHSNALQNILTKKANDINPHQTTPIASVMNIKFKYQEKSIFSTVNT